MDIQLEKLSLKPIERAYLSLLRYWRNDPEIMIRTRQWRELEYNEHKWWFDNLDPNKNLMRLIHHDSEPIGVCGLTNIDWINRSAEVSIYIGKKTARRKGVSTWCINELKRIAFETMNLHRLYAEIYSFNTSSMCSFRKCGFVLDGVIIDTVFRNGSYHDSSIFSLINRKDI